MSALVATPAELAAHESFVQKKLKDSVWAKLQNNLLTA
jgi:hypothetical protein